MSILKSNHSDSLTKWIKQLPKMINFKITFCLKTCKVWFIGKFPISFSKFFCLKWSCFIFLSVYCASNICLSKCHNLVKHIFYWKLFSSSKSSLFFTMLVSRLFWTLLWIGLLVFTLKPLNFIILHEQLN